MYTELSTLFYSRFGDDLLGISVSFSPKRECGFERNPLRTALPCWGQRIKGYQNGSAVLKKEPPLEPQSRFLGTNYVELELNMSRKRECGSERKLCPENGSAVLKGTLLLEQDSRFGNILLGIRVSRCPQNGSAFLKGYQNGSAVLKCLINPFRTALPFWGQMTWN